MKQHTRFAISVLAVALSATLTGCWLLEDPFGEDVTDDRESTVVTSDTTRAEDTSADAVTDVFPPVSGEPATELTAEPVTEPVTEPSTEPATEPATAPVTEPETEPVTEPETEPETVYVPDIRFGYGTIVEYPYEEPMDNVWAIRDYTGDPWIMRFVYFDDPSMDLCVGDEVEFTYDANAEVMESFDGVAVLVALTMEYMPVAVPEKPVIYLYPETPTEVSVKLTVDGKLTCTYPDYDKGWDNFTAHPDGTLIFPDGKQYYCLYWEGIQNMDCDFTQGFCVKGEDTATFLEWALAEQGLTPREANEFIIYWLPRMESNPYNVISFQTEAYTEGAVLDIDPKPDSLLRVFMAYYPSDEAVEMEAQELAPFERVGFTVVEWGGCEVARP